MSVLRRVRVAEGVPAREGWLRRLVRWWHQRRYLRNLTLRVDVQELEAFQREAQYVGLPVEEWAVRRLKGLARPSPAVLDEAFRRIDESDSQREFSTPPPPVMPQTVAQRISVFGKPVPCDHSCAMHAEVQRLDGGPAKLCAAPEQFGKPCYFSAGRASDCVHFRPKGIR